MKHGVSAFVTDTSLSAMDLAREVEERGFESLWLPEHSHLPAGPDADPDGFYARLYDPFVALAAAAAATTTLGLATGVTLVAQRDPLYTAKQVASLDHLSGGRVLLGVGAGWNRAEMRHHGVDPATRNRRLAEHVEAMKALWENSPARYAGEFVSFGDSFAYPMPVRRPPVLVGGMGPGVERRVLDFGDGWLPIGVAARDADGLGRRIAALRRRAAELGRDRVPVTLVNAEPGPAAEDAYRRAGVDRLVHGVTDTDPDVVRKRLDVLAER
ncbi:LLM class F420-dependent oxidoreductase [Amycolatopsis endophytica]|uniref:Putative F420-dependent oxidoreductase n=1 Tax=Amycolatopsis endophytica TaxID=860233 RepID=A0A853B2E9_9PSEU|nr:TIGR03619 family F420-dependent LLM class oxidoreductase [Amycolatopsis endophytica]NYI88826.1 putative F420-dependent oxidoreductase [Amycolatopsis endophytica]